MKAVVLGGAGVEGSYVVKRLSKSETFSEVCIADIAETRARELSENVEKVGYVYLDATDEESLSRGLKDADVAINCIGPFYKFAPLIMEVAIERGVDLIDICDDFDVTRELIDNFHEKAVDAGVTCVVGLGSSPGLTNILASYSSSKLTSVDDICIYVTRGIEEEAGGAIPYHMFHSWLGEVPVYKDGRYRKAKGLVDGKEYVDFPEPFGQAPVYYFGHPETITLPRYIDGVKNVACKGNFFPMEFREALLKIQSLGLLSKESVSVKGQKMTPLDFSAAYLGSLGKMISASGAEIPTGGAIMVEVSGKKDSQPKTYRYSGTGRMHEGTATPASLGAQMIARGDVKSPGVQAPEACIPPGEFINNLLRGESWADAWVTVKEKITGRMG